MAYFDTYCPPVLVLLFVEIELPSLLCIAFLEQLLLGVDLVVVTGAVIVLDGRHEVQHIHVTRSRCHAPAQVRLAFGLAASLRERGRAGWRPYSGPIRLAKLILVGWESVHKNQRI